MCTIESEVKIFAVTGSTLLYGNKCENEKKGKKENTSSSRNYKSYALTAKNRQAVWLKMFLPLDVITHILII